VFGLSAPCVDPPSGVLVPCVGVLFRVVDEGATDNGRGYAIGNGRALC
jgi:hypothetical protein